MERYHTSLNDTTTVTKNYELCGWKNTSHLFKTLTQHLTGSTEKGTECCVRIGGHQDDILTLNIPYMRMKCHTLNPIIKNTGSKPKSPSKIIHAVCTSSTKQTSWTLLSSTLPSLLNTCTEFLAGPGI
jgi:hypothetical protein